jgi:hypothetical protein
MLCPSASAKGAAGQTGLVMVRGRVAASDRILVFVQFFIVENHDQCGNGAVGEECFGLNTLGDCRARTRHRGNGRRHSTATPVVENDTKRDEERST